MPTLTGVAKTYNGSSTSNYVYEVDYSYSQNINSNQTTITATAYLRSARSGISTVSSNWKSTINGTQVWSGSATVSSGRVNFGSRTWTVNHNSDGTGSTSISASFTNGVGYQDSYVVKSGSLSANISLPTIPRTSSFNFSPSSITLGSTQVTVSISRASSSFTHRVRLDYGNTSTYLTTSAGTEYKFTPDINLSSQTPSATSGVGNLVVQTYNGSTYIGETYKQITLKVPDNLVPTYSTITVAGNNLLKNYYVAGKSTATVTINGASGSYGSTIKTVSIKSSNGSYSSSSNPYTTPTLSATSSMTFTGELTDTRNRKVSKTSAPIDVYAYKPPTLSMTAIRTDSNGNPVEDGVYLKIDINYTIDPIVNNINDKKYSVNWREKDGEWQNWNVNQVELETYSGTVQAPFVAGWLINKSYEVKVTLHDYYTNIIQTASVTTASAIFDIEKAGIGVGKYHEKGGLDIRGDVYTDSGVYAEKIIKSKIDLITERHGVTSYFTCSTDDGGSTFIKNSIGGGLLLGSDSGIRFMNKSGTKYTVYHSGNFTPPSIPSELFTPKKLETHNGITVNGVDGGWVRTPLEGLLPYKSGESSSIGTQTWKFANGNFRNGNIDYLIGVQTLNTYRITGISGGWWNAINTVQSNGVTETGAYLDFHSSNTTTADYNSRISVSGSNLTCSGSFVNGSSKELKKDIQYLSKVRKKNRFVDFLTTKFNPAIFKYKNHNIDQLGVIAEDLLNTEWGIAILPYEEYDKKNNKKTQSYGIDSVAYTTLVALSLKEVIIEKDEQINQLEKRVSQLESEIANIKKHLKL